MFEEIGFDVPAAAKLSHKADLLGVLYRAQHERELSQSAFSRLVGIPSLGCPSSTTASWTA